MFAKLAAVASLAILAVATPTPVPTDGGQCNTGELQCCNSVQSAGTPAVATLLGLLGIVAQGVDVPVGLTCDPISAVVGLGSAGCKAQPVCCTNNSFNGVVALGCVPVNVDL